MGKNWRTTAAGVAAMVAAIASCFAALLDNDPATTPDWTTAIAALMAGAGLVAAADAKPGR